MIRILLAYAAVLLAGITPGTAAFVAVLIKTRH